MRANIAHQNLNKLVKSTRMLVSTSLAGAAFAEVLASLHTTKLRSFRPASKKASPIFLEESLSNLVTFRENIVKIFHFMFLYKSILLCISSRKKQILIFETSIELVLNLRVSTFRKRMRRFWKRKSKAWFNM